MREEAEISLPRGRDPVAKSPVRCFPSKIGKVLCIALSELASGTTLISVRKARDPFSEQSDCGDSRSHVDCSSGLRKHGHWINARDRSHQLIPHPHFGTNDLSGPLLHPPSLFVRGLPTQPPLNLQKAATPKTFSKSLGGQTRSTTDDRKRMHSEMREEVSEFQAMGAQHRDMNSVCPRMLRSPHEGGRGTGIKFLHPPFIPKSTASHAQLTTANCRGKKSKV
ncbi:hypothetical protein BS47DRAFT_1488934 [Hydnum rufescens UP504]|uniref:Uncharacterized protein n=1 Tax=Hydnum rufescens UP504 TaxID=1448309 RepID=A0A9P6AK92_9AGAM|nr:hypothetical protein BS47DRAFT_1488934 [Hydnum rufescens UP504]